MEVLISSFFGEGSGVMPDVIGKKAQDLLCTDSDQLLIISEILSCIAQKRDIKVTFFND